MGVTTSTLVSNRVTLSDLFGTPTHDTGQTTTTPGSVKSVLTVSVASGKKRNFTKVWLSCSREGKMIVKKNSTEIAWGRCGAGNHNIDFSWTPVLQCVASDTIDVEFLAPTGESIVDVEVVLMSVENDA